MKALKLFGCLSILLFMSCSQDSLTYYVDTELKASKTIYERKGTAIQEATFFLNLKESEDFKTFLPELYDLEALDLYVKTDKSIINKLKNTTLKIGNTTILLDGKIDTSEGTIRIKDKSLMSRVASELFKNKLAPITLDYSKLHENDIILNGVTIDVVTNLKGTFVGEH